MAFGICLDFKLRKIFFRGVLEVVMQVNHRRCGIAHGGGPEYEPEPVGQVHESSEYMCHKYHPLP